MTGCGGWCYWSVLGFLRAVARWVLSSGDLYCCWFECWLGFLAGFFVGCGLVVVLGVW